MCRTQLLAKINAIPNVQQVQNLALENNTQARIQYDLFKGDANDPSKRNITSYGNNFCQDLTLQTH